ncbi:MAG TPA: hypothetical protein ENK57_19120 [Polyangiaceae bacterium]|nr:hypothetical protein [Polyangiaceae bacterium]
MARGLPLASSASWLVWLALGLLACGEARLRPDTSDGWGPTGNGLGAAPASTTTRRPVPRATAIPVAERETWPHAAVLEAMTPVDGRGPSEHLSGRYERRVRVNEEASRYRELVSHQRLPVGAIVAQSHHPSGSEAVVSWYVMEKIAEERWRFLVLDPERRIAAHEDLELCVRCHAEAPHDHLFGPPPTAQIAPP